MEKLLEEKHLLDWWEFILGESPDNPFTRIACQWRKLKPTICDGTCSWYRKDRETFLSTEPNRLREMDIMSSGGDNYFEIMPIDHYKISIELKVMKLNEIKRQIIEKRLRETELMTTVNERWRILTLQAMSPSTESATLH
jgi:hypothetical protein